MSAKIVVLGAGMVGRAMCLDLAESHSVTAVDRDPQSLAKFDGSKVLTQQADLSDSQRVAEVIEDADLVVGAVPGFMGFATLETVIKAGKNIVDISFFPEDPFRLNDLALQHDVIAVMDAGVAPGMSNLILGYHDQRMKVEEFLCYVGGLPRERVWPYEYKAPFSPIDVIEEYTRPARYQEGGEVIEVAALTDPEILEFPGVGELESFNTDGLRSLLQTMQIPNMKEKTLRYPGHIELMRTLRETGFFSEEELELSGARIRPIDLTTRLLFPMWKLGEREEEFTVMQILVRGQEASYRYDMLDRFDAASGFSSMARTTGFTCTAIANLVIDGSYDRKGISPPEFVGASPGCYEKVLGYLEERNIEYKLTQE